MNSFSTFGGMIFGKGGKTNVNSFSYINGFSKSLTIDFSGSSVIDLSNASASSYAKTACGMNIDNNNTTFARIKYGTNYLNTSDFNTGSFTFYVKHSSKFSTLPPLNFQYPNVIQHSASAVEGGSSFTTTFYSSLNPRTTVPYLITGCTSTDLNGASLTGNLISPYQLTTYTTTSSGVGKTISFNISGGITKTIAISAAPITYTMSISGGSVFSVTDSTPLTFTRPRLCFFSGSTYKFIQSDSTNTGHQIYFSTTPNGTLNGGTAFTTGVTVYGTAGQANAYTTLTLTSNTRLFYCCDISGAGSSNLDMIQNNSTTIFANKPTTTVGALYGGEFDDFYVGYLSMCCSKDGKVVWFSPYNINIYLSIDYGKTFVLFGKTPYQFQGYHNTITCDDTGYICFMSTHRQSVVGGKLYKINYAAQTITDITPASISSRALTVKINSTGSCLIVVSDNAIFKSTDLGVTFTNIQSVDFTLDQSPSCIAMDSTGQYIATCGNYLGGVIATNFYKTINYGVSWDKTFNNQPTNFPASNSTGNFLYAAYSYNGAALVVYVQNAGIYLSNDHGYIWSILTTDAINISGLGNNGPTSNPCFVLDISGEFLVYNSTISSQIYPRKYNLLTNSITNLASGKALSTTRNIMCSDAYLFNVYTLPAGSATSISPGTYQMIRTSV